MVSRQTFIDYLAALAEKDETFLLVKQKCIGVKDDKPQYTWPSYLPTAKTKTNESWYGNTGSFIVSRFSENKPSASINNCEHVLVMVLDDIGTKAKESPLPPTWKIETSFGCQQWGYVFSQQPTKHEYMGAISGIANAGFSDPGAVNPVRNFRLPDSINLKAGKDKFAARLIEFHPKREFTLSEICSALDVTPETLAPTHNQYVTIKDTLNDSILMWLNQHKLVLQPLNDQGWVGIVCPNHKEHTDDNIDARYRPLERAFRCYHAHCLNITSQNFLDWVKNTGGPAEEYGVREELITYGIEEALKKIEPNNAFDDKALTLELQNNINLKIKKDRDTWHARYMLVQQKDGYFFDLQERKLIKCTLFDKIYRGVPCKSAITKRHVTPSIWFEENREMKKSTTLRNVTYAPGSPAIVEVDGELCGNLWSNKRPDISEIKTSDIAVWINHCKKIVPNVEELEHVWDVMACKIQRPATKINHAVLITGTHGSGKDLMWKPFFWALGGPSFANHGQLDNRRLNSNFSYGFENEVVVLIELKEDSAKERRALANTLKPIIAAPPYHLTINRKGKDEYSIPNRILIIAFSNYDIPISLEYGERRWFCIKSPAVAMTEEEATAYINWCDQGGFAAVAKWLHERDISNFNAGKKPPETDFGVSLVDNSLSAIEENIEYLINRKTSVFAKGVIAAPFNLLCEQLLPLIPNAQRITPQALFYALRKAGWIDLGRVASTKYSTKKQLYAAPEYAVNYTKSVLRNIVEDEKTLKLELVN